jgi:hypothetical protein
MRKRRGRAGNIILVGVVSEYLTRPDRGNHSIATWSKMAERKLREHGKAEELKADLMSIYSSTC